MFLWRKVFIEQHNLLTILTTLMHYLAVTIHINILLGNANKIISFFPVILTVLWNTEIAMHWKLNKKQQNRERCRQMEIRNYNNNKKKHMLHRLQVGSMDAYIIFKTYKYIDANWKAQQVYDSYSLKCLVYCWRKKEKTFT